MTSTKKGRNPVFTFLSYQSPFVHAQETHRKNGVSISVNRKRASSTSTTSWAQWGFRTLLLNPERTRFPACVTLQRPQRSPVRPSIPTSGGPSLAGWVVLSCRRAISDLNLPPRSGCGQHCPLPPGCPTKGTPWRWDVVDPAQKKRRIPVVGRANR